MNHQPNPFAALDKALLSSSPAKKPVEKEAGPNSADDQLTEEKVLSPSQPATQQASNQPSNQDTTVSRNHEITASQSKDTPQSRSQDNVIEAVRKAVKQLGKEAATYRFTKAEKNALAEIVYNNRNKGVRTSENELTRISINYLILDYQDKGEASILAQILDRLNA